MKTTLLRVLVLFSCPILAGVVGYGAGSLGLGTLGIDAGTCTLVSVFGTGPLGAVAGIFTGLGLALRDD